MCGFTGILRFGAGLKEHDLSALSSMTGSLVHRGPDAQGVWHEGPAALGHRRLSILDLTDAASQPMESANGRYVMAYNGEVYNFEEIREALAREGVSFQSRSDTEVMLEAFALWGIEKSLSLFNGMFAFALWDKEKKRLILCRDQVGIKPLFWARIPGGIVFGSELKALKRHPEFRREVDREALGDYFARTYISAPRTIYKECFRLLPGHIAIFSQDGGMMQSAYATGNDLSCDLGGISGREFPDAFERELGRAVSRHMRADVPVAAFLSGGNDSALIAALLSRAGNFKTYSVGYAEKKYDESGRAEEIARHLSLSHETIFLVPKDAESVIDKLSGFYDEPFADASALPTFMLSRYVSSYAKVALSGDGADELFAGYPRYIHAAGEWKRLGLVPSALRPLLSSLIPEDPPGWMARLASPVLRNPEQSIPYIRQMLGEKSILTGFFRQNYIGVPLVALKDQSLIDVAYRDIESYKDGSGLLRTLLNYDQSIRLPDGMLTKVDRASMAASLEVRVPFLDRDIIAFSRKLNEDAIASPSAQPKKIIKDVLRRYLPEEIVNAPKVGFHIPMKLWLRTHFREWAQDLLEAEDDPNLDMSSVQRLWAEYAGGGRDDLFYGLWSILMYRQWMRVENAI